MAVEFIKLPFSKDALVPYMSEDTLDFHYGKHHKHYVDTLNQLIRDTPLDKITLEEIMSLTVNKSEKIYENAAQVWNHNFFWNCLTDSGENISEDCKKIIERDFFSFAKFRDDFDSQAYELFGSGWIWLAQDKQGLLKIRSLKNEGNPLSQYGETPLLALDVWEHAYYLDYQNERPKYVDNFWNIVNWQFVEKNLRLPAPEFSRAREAGA